MEKAAQADMAVVGALLAAYYIKLVGHCLGRKARPALSAFGRLLGRVALQRVHALIGAVAVFLRVQVAAFFFALFIFLDRDAVGFSPGVLPDARCLPAYPLIG